MTRFQTLTALFWGSVFAAAAVSASTPVGQDARTRCVYDHGAVIRGDTGRKELALVFTGHEFADGGAMIADVLKKDGVPAGFFFTGDFYRAVTNALLIVRLRQDGHYLGVHSDRHLLYCSWEDRKKLLVTKAEFVSDIFTNYDMLSAFGFDRRQNPWFIPPYEWYNETVVAWAKELGLVLFNNSPGTLSAADYTTPDMPNYRSSAEIFRSILDHEKKDPHGLNGFILLLHIGTAPARTDKFYSRLDDLIIALQDRGYGFVRIDRLLGGPKDK